MVITGENIDIDINKKDVCHHIGYGTGSEPRARISTLIDDYIENADQIIEPSYSYIIRDIEWVRNSITFIEGSIIFKSQIVAQLLQQCSKVAVFLATIGNHLEDTAYQLTKEGMVLQAMVLDAVGSGAAEQLADSVQDRIGEVAGAEGLFTSRRFSPGYCDWDIGQQRMIFWAMNSSLSGIRLNGQCLMLPQKSISGIIGLGQDSEMMRNYNPCRSCRKSNCPGRR